MLSKGSRILLQIRWRKFISSSESTRKLKRRRERRKVGRAPVNFVAAVHVAGAQKSFAARAEVLRLVRGGVSAEQCGVRHVVGVRRLAARVVGGDP